MRHARALHLVPHHAKGRMPRFMLDENKQWYPLKDALKRTLIHVQWNQFLAGEKPNNETTRTALRNALNGELENRNIQSKSLQKRARQYIEKKVNDFQFRQNDTYNTSFFLTKGTNLLSEVIRTEKGNFYQIVTQLDDRLAARIESQQGAPYSGGAKLGKGAAGKIRLAERLDEHDGTVVAAKTHRKDITRLIGLQLRKTDLRAYITNEAEHYKSLPATKHFSRVRDLVYVEDNKGVSRLYLFMDLHIRGDMIDVLTNLGKRQDLNIKSKQKILRTIAFQMIEAVAEMHQLLIYHRDLKPENFLFSKDGTVVATDFGTASTDNAIAKGHTSGYIPPEAGKPGSTNVNGDKYALGRTLRAICAAFPDLSAVDNYELLSNADSLAADNPDARPSLEDLLQSSYFQGEKYSDEELLELVNASYYVPGGAGGLEMNSVLAGLPDSDEPGSRVGPVHRQQAYLSSPAGDSASMRRRRFTPEHQRPYTPTPSNTTALRESGAPIANRRISKELDNYLTTGQLPDRPAESNPVSSSGFRQKIAAPLKRFFNARTGTASAQPADQGQNRLSIE